jgi:DHA1 family tetracycline resistance protein-like MFS transporter
MQNVNKQIAWGRILPLYVVIFVGFFGYALTVALFIPLLLSTHGDLVASITTTSVRMTIAGCLLAMYPLGQFIGSPIIGNLADHYGKKKLLLISMLMCIAGFILMALSIQCHWLTLLFISSFFTGLCESNMAIAQSIIASMTQDNALKTKLIGYAYSACSLGYISGPLIGGLLLSFGLHVSFSFWVTAIAIIPLLVWIKYYVTLPEKNIQHKSLQLLSAITSMRSLFNRPKLRFFYAINFIVFFAIQGLYRVVPMYVQDVWHPTIQVFTGLISFVSFLCLLANLFLIGPLAKRFSTKALLISFLVFSGVFVFTIIIPKTFSWIWLTFGLAALPTVIALTASTTWLSHHADTDEQGQVLGNNQALLVLAEASSSAVGGAIAAVHVSLPIIIMGTLLLLSAGIVFFKRK